MVESVCHLLMKVYHVIVANFYVANMSLNAIRENKILAKISEFTIWRDGFAAYQHTSLEASVNLARCFVEYN